MGVAQTLHHILDSCTNFLRVRVSSVYHLYWGERRRMEGGGREERVEGEGEREGREEKGGDANLCPTYPNKWFYLPVMVESVQKIK